MKLEDQDPFEQRRYPHRRSRYESRQSGFSPGRKRLSTRKGKSTPSEERGELGVMQPVTRLQNKTSKESGSQTWLDGIRKQIAKENERDRVLRLAMAM